MKKSILHKHQKRKEDPLWVKQLYKVKASSLTGHSKPLQSKAVPLHAMVALGGRGGIAPTHSWPRH
jgi:hypothetical protein